MSDWSGAVSPSERTCANCGAKLTEKEGIFCSGCLEKAVDPFPRTQ